MGHMSRLSIREQIQLKQAKTEYMRNKLAKKLVTAKLDKTEDVNVITEAIIEELDKSKTENTVVNNDADTIPVEQERLDSITEDTLDTETKLTKKRLTSIIKSRKTRPENDLVYREVVVKEEINEEELPYAQHYNTDYSDYSRGLITRSSQCACGHWVYVRRELRAPRCCGRISCSRKFTEK